MENLSSNTCSMKTMMRCKLVTIDDVQEFCREANKIPSDVIVRSNLFKVTGKSILGMYSINLSEPFWLEIDSSYVKAFERWQVANGYNEC